MNLKTLLPINSLQSEEDKHIYDELYRIIKNTEARNIGITGRYGSGKSSFIKSFFNYVNNIKDCNAINPCNYTVSVDDNSSTKKYDTQVLENKIILTSESDNKVYKYKLNKRKINIESNRSINKLTPLYISLATFGNLSSRRDKQQNIETIENCILQQIIYNKKPETLPRSRIKRIWNESIYIIRKKATCLIFSVLTLFSLLIIDKIPVPKSILQINEQNLKFLIFFILLIIFLTSSCFLFAEIFKRTNEFKISKLKDVEIDAGQSNSLLNQNIDEILYFFEMTDYNIVVFEDIDRFNQREVFDHLREINLIINEYEGINRKIVFMYAVRDDLFAFNSLHTKFFDLIIPIIPIVDVNSVGGYFGKLKNNSEYNSFIKDFENEFIEDISYYIPDLRTLFNILNEFCVYQEKLKIENVKDKQKLFVLILLKNISPIDYNKLQDNKGPIVDFLNSEHKLVQYVKDQILEEIEKGKKSEQSYKYDLIELRKQYLREYFEFCGISITDKDLFYLSAEKNFSDIKNAGQKKVPLGSGVFDFDYSVFLSRVINSKNYEMAQDDLNHAYIKIQNENRFREILQNSQISQITFDSIKSNYMRYKEIIDNFLNIHNIHLNTKVFKLLLSGYIDCSYKYIISFFYTGLLTQNDNNFIKNVLAKYPNDPKTELNNYEIIIKKLDKESELNKAVLNHGLLDYLMNHEEKNEKFMSRYMEILTGEYSSDFIRDSVFKNENSSEIFNYIAVYNNTYWNSFFIRLRNETEQDTFIRYYFMACQYDNIEISKTDYISKYISTHPEKYNDWFKGMDDIDISKKLKVMDVEFTKIKGLFNKELLNRIIEEGLFEINVENIIAVCTIFEGDEELKNDPVHDIIQLLEKEDNEYLKTNFNKIVQVFLNSDDWPKHNSVFRLSRQDRLPEGADGQLYNQYFHKI